MLLRLLATERHQIRGSNINQPSLAALNQALPSAGRPVTNSFVPYRGYATITEFISDANGNYNGLQTYLTKRKGNLNLTVSYTWSKMLNEADSYNDAGDAVEHTTRRFNYGPADRDRRHVFVSTYTYRIPIFRRNHGFPGAALGGWELSGIVRAQSGAYLTPTGTVVDSGDSAVAILGRAGRAAVARAPRRPLVQHIGVSERARDGAGQCRGRDHSGAGLDERRSVAAQDLPRPRGLDAALHGGFVQYAEPRKLQ